MISGKVMNEIRKACPGMDHNSVIFRPFSTIDYWLCMRDPRYRAYFLSWFSELVLLVFTGNWRGRLWVELLGQLLSRNHDFEFFRHTTPLPCVSQIISYQSFISFCFLIQFSVNFIIILQTDDDVELSKYFPSSNN